jgi:hypothetical protein
LKEAAGVDDPAPLKGRCEMGFDRKFLLCSIAYAIAGMGVGVYMGASSSDAQTDAHSHILLVGFVGSFVYALVHRLWIAGIGAAIAGVQFYLHQVATLLMCSSLLLVYGGVVPGSTLRPVLGASSVGVLAGAVLIGYMILRAPRSHA